MQLEMPFHHFAVLAMENVVSHDIAGGLIKSALFGLVIGLIACHKGLTATQGATGVGLATTSSVVLSISSVIGCDTLCNVVLQRIWP
jgi:phospholipid/cholesterol/gamma-HCH transport system permease protein